MYIYSSQLLQFNPLFSFELHILLRFGEKKYSQESSDISDLVISRDVSHKISNKNQPNSILRKFHNFIIGLLGLFALNALTKIKYFGENQKQNFY